MKFVINKNSDPPPEDAQTAGDTKRRTVFPWPEMEVNDSVDLILKTNGERSSAASSLSYYKLRNPEKEFRFKVELEGEGSKTRIMTVWRTA